MTWYREIEREMNVRYSVRGEIHRQEVFGGEFPVSGDDLARMKAGDRA